MPTCLLHVARDASKGVLDLGVAVQADVSLDPPTCAARRCFNMCAKSGSVSLGTHVTVQSSCMSMQALCLTNEDALVQSQCCTVAMSPMTRGATC